MNKRIRVPGYAIALLISLAWAPSLLAQHAMHNMGNSSELALETMPADDAVLATAPRSLMLHFGSDVRLVKLAVRNPDNDLMNIGFRYRPLPGQEFMQSLPQLEEDDYYRVEWATIDASGKLIKGMFHFSFGADARPPSYWLEQQEQMRHIMSPDYRLLQPGQ